MLWVLRGGLRRGQKCVSGRKKPSPALPDEFSVLLGPELPPSHDCFQTCSSHRCLLAGGEQWAEPRPRGRRAGFLLPFVWTVW